MYHSRFIIACMFALTCGAVPMIVHATLPSPNYHSFTVTGDEKTYCCCKRRRSQLCQMGSCDGIEGVTKASWGYQTKGTVIHNDVNSIVNNDENYEDSFITCNDGALTFEDRKYYSDNDYGLKDGEITGGEHDVYFFDPGSKKLYPEESGFCQPAMDAVLLRACKADYILDDESGCQSITDVNVQNKMCKQNKAHTFINEEDKILTYKRHQLDEYCISGTHCVYETSGNYFNCGEGHHETIEDCNSSDCPDGDCKVELYTKDGNPFIYNTQTILKDDLSQFCLHKISHTPETRSEHLNDLREQCRGSGGTWNKDAKSCSCHHRNMVLDGTKCRCADYHRRTDLSDISQGCTRQDMDQQNCNGTDMQWLESSATCKCKAEGYYYNIDTYKCDPLADYTLCLALSEQATWDDTNKKCVCKNGDTKFFAGKCVDTDEYITLTAEQAAQDAAIEQIGRQGDERKEATRERFGRYNTHSPIIKEKHSVLEEMRLQFDSSVWRDKEGKLNVARIVSDSVAGVALGTTGGVVINNMMKKDQVEDGFEDLKCKIGTEVVAEWGEVFRAGQ